jgi:hypothetical protein
VAPAAARETYRESDVMSFICSSVNQHLRMIYYVVLNRRVSGQRKAYQNDAHIEPISTLTSKAKEKEQKKKKRNKIRMMKGHTISKTTSRQTPQHGGEARMCNLARNVFSHTHHKSRDNNGDSRITGRKMKKLTISTRRQPKHTRAPETQMKSDPRQ